MFAWLYRLLFARRVRWVLTHETEDGPSKARFILYDPSPEDIEEVEANHIRPLVEMGWTVLHRPRQA